MQSREMSSDSTISEELENSSVVMVVLVTAAGVCTHDQFILARYGLMECNL